jgi:dTDP-4-dehydrorhamnose reductase
MLTCAITGSKGVLGTKLKKKIPLKFYEFDGDITNKNKVNQWIQKKHFDILIHLAAIVPTNLVNKNYKKAYEVNVIGTNNLINSLKKKKINQNGFSFLQHLMFINH